MIGRVPNLLCYLLYSSSPIDPEPGDSSRILTLADIGTRTEDAATPYEPRELTADRSLRYLQGQMTDLEEQSFEIELLSDPQLALEVELDMYLRDGLAVWAEMIRA